MAYRRRNIVFGLGRSITPAVKYLIIFNVSFFIVQKVLGIDWFDILGLVPAMVFKGWIWQPVTYLFIHGSFFHLLFNMLFLWMFGNELERLWGTREFLKYYFLTGVGAGLCVAAVKFGSMIPTIGASGAVLAVILAFGLTFPEMTLYLYFIIPIKAKYFVWLALAFEFFFTLYPAGDAVSHLAHLGGMMIGLLYLQHDKFVRIAARWLKRRMDRRRVERQKKMFIEEERVRAEVDELLDKINRIGLQNLTKDERRRLDDASRYLRERAQQYQTK